MVGFWALIALTLAPAVEEIDITFKTTLLEEEIKSSLNKLGIGVGDMVVDVGVGEDANETLDAIVDAGVGAS